MRKAVWPVAASRLPPERVNPERAQPSSDRGRLSLAARRFGIASSASVTGLGLAYGVTLLVGLASLASPADVIADPMFTILELLILLMAPAMIGMMVAVHAWAAPQTRPVAVAALTLMAIAAAITACVHFAVLTLSRHAAFQAAPWDRVLSFRWPSLAYTLDILAWDMFFALAMLAAAPLFAGSRLARVIRALMIAAGLFALAGLAGVAANDMRIRNVGIVGYGGLFPVVAALLAILFHRARG